MNEPQDKALKSLSRAHSALLQAIAADRFVPGPLEPRVHEAIDLLRAASAEEPLVRRVEEISCTLHVMHRFLREGRVNAYDSARLRLRSAATSLSGSGPAAAW